MAGLTEVGHIARWDGWSWNPVGYLSGPWSLATYKGELVAGDPAVSPFSVIKRWDGVNWNPFEPGLTGSPVTMAEYGGDLYVGGYFEYAEGNPVTHLVRWDGSHWSDFGTTLAFDQPIIWGTSPVEVLTTEYDGSLLVGGSFSHVNGIYANGLARWDGLNWTGLGAGLGVPAAITDIAVYNGELVVVGGFVLPGGGASIARWDGDSWKPFESGILLLQPTTDAALSVDVLDGDLYVTGNFLEAGAKTSYFMARWWEIGTSTPVLISNQSSPRLWVSSANPTSSGADIGFSLPVCSRVDLSIFDLAGRRVATLMTGMYEAGISQARWDGRSGESGFASGVYFVRLQTENERLVQKVVVRK